MRAFLMTAPWWKLSLLTGVAFALLFGAVMAIIVPAGTGLLVALGAGALFGLVMGPALARLNARARAVIGPMSTAQYGEVLRAARRGPVPADPQIREAATRLVRWRLDEAARHRTGLLVLVAILLALTVVRAIMGSPIDWFFVPIWVVVPVAHVWEQKRLRQRVALLEGQDVSA